MDRKELIKMYKNGLISSKPYNYLQIKDKVSQYKSGGMTRTEAVGKVASLMGLSTRTIWKALNATEGINLS